MSKIIDISHHQETIDWTKTSKEIDLAIIRVQYGSTTIDRKYKDYIAGCKEHNIPFGHYAYALYLSVADAEKEANDFLSRIDKSAKFLAVDVEEITVRDIRDLIPATQRFIDVCKKAGYKVGLYSGEHFFKNYGLAKIKADFLWVAKYSSNKPSVPHDIWQNTSSGSVAGIVGKVDLNQLSGSKPVSYFKGVPARKFFITTGGYTEENVSKILGFLMDNKFWYQSKRKETGSLEFYVGGFIEGSESAIKMVKFLDENKFWYEKKY